MKKIWHCYVALTATAMLFVACNNGGKDNTAENNPVFSHPAIAGITMQIKQQPANADLYFKRGLMLDDLQEDSLAVQDFNKAISLDSSKAEYYSAVGDVLFEHKDLDGSVKWLEKALKLNPNDPAAHLKMAKMFVYTKEYTSAFSEINTVLRQDVYNPEGYFLKGMIYKDLKDTSKAISSFQTAESVDPRFIDAMLQLGLLYSAKHDPLALKYFDKAFAIDTTDVFPLYAKGVYYQDSKDFEAAKAQYKRAILQDKNYENAYFNMGYILMQQDSLDKAYRQYDILTQLSPASAEAYYNRGLCNELMGKKEQAIMDFKQAIVFDSEYEEPREGLKRLGDK
jgi:tetratricopeptide (TPR) repeat protein